MTWVWQHSRSKKTERLVLLAIADCASDDGANAYPSMSELIRKTGLSERGVQYAVRNLVGLGELFVGANDGPRGCNRYRVIMSGPADTPTPAQLAPRTACTPNVMQGAQPSPPEHAAPQPPNDVRGTPERAAPGTVLEPSVEPSVRTKTTGRTRGSRIPDDFRATPEMVAWARENTPLVGTAETDAFVDYFRGAPGQKGVKTDWPATWRNWMRRAQSDRESRNGRSSSNSKPHQAYRNPADMSVYEEGL